MREMEEKFSPFLLQENLITKIEKSRRWQDSNSMVNSIRLSAAYIVELFIEGEKLKKEPKFEIRTSTKQDRHVTPMAIIERIIRHSLQTEAEVEIILYSLKSKLEAMKINFSEADNDTIQGIFEYFSNPRFQNAKWERGLNENTNGLIRQYFKKGSDFSSVTEQDLQVIMDKLNNRPRKTLGYKTPNEIFGKS